ncbi:MAG: metal-dependent phosphohydrolase [Acidimicrobiales bacterium]
MSPTDLHDRSFTRMDRSTPEQWQVIVAETAKNQPRVPAQILSMLKSLSAITDGFPIDQLAHSLQTATRAERDGAGEEVIVASLCHDIGKVVSVFNHPRIASEVLRPYVSDDLRCVIQAHQDFQGRHYYSHLGMNPDARAQYSECSWCEIAEKFADDWDQVSFDPDYPNETLDHFEPLVQDIFSRPRSL